MAKTSDSKETVYWQAENTGFTNGCCWFPTVPGFKYSTKEEARKANQRYRSIFTGSPISYRIVETRITETYHKDE